MTETAEGFEQETVDGGTVKLGKRQFRTERIEVSRSLVSKRMGELIGIYGSAEKVRWKIGRMRSATEALEGDRLALDWEIGRLREIKKYNQELVESFEKRIEDVHKSTKRIEASLIDVDSLFS